MQPLLTKNVLKKISRYSGEGGECEARDFLRRIHEYLAYAGSKGTLRKWCVCSTEGFFTLPPDMEIPLKYIDNGRLGKVWDKWFEFSGQATDFESQVGVVGMFEDVNPYYTVYDGPTAPFNVLVTPYGPEEEDAHVIVSGWNAGTDEPVRTEYKGRWYEGEYIEVNNDEPRYSRTFFSPVLGQIIKTKTTRPVRLEWLNPETMEQGFLVDLPPREEVTTFKRINLKPSRRSGRVHNSGPEIDTHGIHKLTILGRARLKAIYEDHDVLPFDSEELYISTAQMLNLRDRNEMEDAAAKEATVQRTVKAQLEYSKTTTSQPSIVTATLPGRRQRMFIRRRY